MNEKGNFICYIDKRRRDETAINLILFGYAQLKRAYIIQNLQLLKETLIRKSEGEIDNFDFQTITAPFLMENLRDAICITIFFENFMKAALISNGFLVHKIKPQDKFIDFSKQQKKKPVRYEDFSNLEPFQLNDLQTHLTHVALNAETISISSILYNSGYGKNAGLPESLLKTIAEINHKRNELHFLNGWVMSLSLSMVNELESLNTFAVDFVNKMKRT